MIVGFSFVQTSTSSYAISIPLCMGLCGAGRKLEDVFSEFEEKPIGCASIGQVEGLHWSQHELCVP